MYPAPLPALGTTTPRPETSNLAFSPHATELAAGLADHVSHLGAVASGASQAVSNQAASFAAAANGGGSNGMPINVSQVALYFFLHVLNGNFVNTLRLPAATEISPFHGDF